MEKYFVIIVIAMLLFTPFPAFGQESGKKILYLGTSEGFAHSPTVSQDGKRPLAEQVIERLADDLGASLTTTKDASQINAENLAGYDLVIFYTQGDLTKPNKDGTPTMSKTGVAELIDWIRNGGGFIGFHSATDTFRSGTDEVTPYVGMIGAEFRGHGQQFVGTVQVVDPRHFTMQNVPTEWRLREEWYMFRNFNKATMHVLALLEPGDERAKQESYDIPAFPIIWCSELGKGRVFYNGLGHRDDIWTNNAFQKSVIDTCRWAMGRGRAMSRPNYDEVTPTTKPDGS